MKTMLLLAVWLGLVMGTEADTVKTVKVFVLAGQSNMEGKAKNSLLGLMPPPRARRRASKVFLMNPDAGSRRAYPVFSVGATGLRVSIETGLVVTVQGEVQGSPAVGKCKPGDIITGVNG